MAALLVTWRQPLFPLFCLCFNIISLSPLWARQNPFWRWLVDLLKVIHLCCYSEKNCVRVFVCARVCVGPCVRGGLAVGQIYEPYQSSSSLMKCLDGAFCKMGSAEVEPRDSDVACKKPWGCVWKECVLGQAADRDRLGKRVPREPSPQWRSGRCSFNNSSTLLSNWQFVIIGQHLLSAWIIGFNLLPCNSFTHPCLSLSSSTFLNLSGCVMYVLPTSEMVIGCLSHRNPKSSLGEIAQVLWKNTRSIKTIVPSLCLTLKFIAEFMWLS